MVTMCLTELCGSALVHGRGISTLWGANVLAGVARMVVAFGDQLRDETFKERVGFMSVRQLSRITKERGAGSLCYAEAMLVAYNRKCKYTL